jgi:hypothetical protein
MTTETDIGTPFEAVARVMSKADTSSKDGTVSLWRIGLLLPGESRPWDWTAFEDTQGIKDLAKNELYRFQLVRKANPNGQYPYRNILGVLGPADESQMGPGQPSKAGTTAQPPPSSRQGDGTEATAWADHPSKRRSIERQQALGCAIEWLPKPDTGEVVKDQAGQLLLAATMFYEWISAGTAPAAAQGPHTAASTGIPTSESTPDASGPSPGDEWVLRPAEIVSTDTLAKAAADRFGMSRSEVVQIVGANKPGSIQEFDEAWDKILGSRTGNMHSEKKETT